MHSSDDVEPEVHPKAREYALLESFVATMREAGATTISVHGKELSATVSFLQPPVLAENMRIRVADDDEEEPHTDSKGRPTNKMVYGSSY